MKTGSIFAALSERLEGNKKLKLAVYAGVAGIALLIFVITSRGGMHSSVKDAGNEDHAASSAGSESEAGTLERRLEELLSSMNGVGRVRVMITFESTSELVIATEDESSENGNGSSTGSRPATLSGSGGESPIVLTELNPKIRGVVVIAEGASNIAVKMDIIAAASTVLGIKEGNVEVFEMNAG